MKNMYKCDSYDEVLSLVSILVELNNLSDPSEKKKYYLINNSINNYLISNIDSLTLENVKFLSNINQLDKKDLVINKLFSKYIESDTINNELLNLLDAKPPKEIKRINLSIKDVLIKKLTLNVPVDIQLIKYVIINNKKNCSEKDLTLINNYLVETKAFKVLDENTNVNEVLQLIGKYKNNHNLESLLLKKDIMAFFYNVNLVNNDKAIEVFNKNELELEKFFTQNLAQGYNLYFKNWFIKQNKELQSIVEHKLFKFYNANKNLFKILFKNFDDNFLKMLDSETIKIEFNSRDKIDIKGTLHNLDSSHEVVIERSLDLNILQSVYFTNSDPRLLNAIKNNFEIFNQEIIEVNNLLEEKTSFCSFLFKSSTYSSLLENLSELNNILDRQSHLLVNNYVINKYIMEENSVLTDVALNLVNKTETNNRNNFQKILSLFIRNKDDYKFDSFNKNLDFLEKFILKVNLDVDLNSKLDSKSQDKNKITIKI